MWAVAQAAQAFARAEGLHFDVVRGDDDIHIPYAPRAADARKIITQARIALKLGLNRGQHRLRLLGAVHNNRDDFVRAFAAQQIKVAHRQPDRRDLRHQRGLSLATWGCPRIVAPLSTADDLTQTARGETVKLARLSRNIVRKISTGKIGVIV